MNMHGWKAPIVLQVFKCVSTGTCKTRLQSEKRLYSFDSFTLPTWRPSCYVNGCMGTIHPGCTLMLLQSLIGELWCYADTNKIKLPTHTILTFLGHTKNRYKFKFVNIVFTLLWIPYSYSSVLTIRNKAEWIISEFLAAFGTLLWAIIFAHSFSCLNTNALIPWPLIVSVVGGCYWSMSLVAKFEL